MYPSHAVKSFCVLLVAAIGGAHGVPLQSAGDENSLYGVPGSAKRPLIIKAFPAIENFQSELFEVYAEPYTYDLRPQAAVAVFIGEGDNDVGGEILFLQRHPPAGPTLIKGNLTGLSPGKHGLHIHQSGDLRHGCEKLGGHFNPYHLHHGGPPDPLRHAGDLGNVVAGEDGTAEISMVNPLISLSAGPRGAIGRAVVVTSDPDDLGHGGTADSLTTGQSGSPLACGLIAYIK